MTSPFTPSASAPGRGLISVCLLPPSTPHLTTLSYTYPLKLISPSHPAQKAILVFLLSYGGGLVSGDAVTLSADVLADARLALVTQGSTKIFKARSPDVVSSQTLNVRVEAGAALCLLPDPVQPFAGSVYEQRQVFRVNAATASLLVLDWVSEGRTARGERWDFVSWRGRNEVWTLEEPAKLLLRDNVILSGDGQSPLDQFTSERLETRMDNLGIFGTLIVRGPLFTTLSTFLIEEFFALPRIGSGSRRWHSETSSTAIDEKRASRHKREQADGILWTAAAVRGFVVVKMGARNVEGARNWVREMVGEVVEREFGEGSLLCMR
jgi:urease accessory protein